MAHSRVVSGHMFEIEKESSSQQYTFFDSTENSKLDSSLRKTIHVPSQEISQMKSPQTYMRPQSDENGSDSHHAPSLTAQ